MREAVKVSSIHLPIDAQGGHLRSHGGWLSASRAVGARSPPGNALFRRQTSTAGPSEAFETTWACVHARTTAREAAEVGRAKSACEAAARSRASRTCSARTRDARALDIAEVAIRHSVCQPSIEPALAQSEGLVISRRIAPGETTDRHRFRCVRRPWAVQRAVMLRVLRT